LIQVTRALATELGHTEHTVRINSLGDRDSVTRYTREVTNFLKKRLDHMPPNARELMKEHPLAALSNLLDEDHDLGQRSPSPLEFLSDNSRKHFREIIEYLDMSETPYEIDPKMMAHHEYYSDAIFSIDVAGEEGSLSIKGGRFNEFMQRNTKSKTPAVGAVVVLKNVKLPARLPRIKSVIPSVYLVHLGFGPKIRSLTLINDLRQAGIPVMHNLASDSLSTQLRDAEAKGVRFTVIMGQKEFVEGTVILRDMNVRNQEYLEQGLLVKRLKKKTPSQV
ncbi:MAG: His/Gly/Thr/Pro-type tRNA ligase C-terminal domain-containing protein, partial [Patescibacteria group bacterium]